MIIATIKSAYHKMERIFMNTENSEQMNHTDLHWISQISLILKIQRKMWL